MPQSGPLTHDLHNMNMLNPAVNSPGLYLSSLCRYSHSNIEHSKCRKSDLYIHPASQPHSNATGTPSQGRSTQYEYAESIRQLFLSISLAVVELFSFKHRNFGIVTVFTLHLNHIPRPQALLSRTDLHKLNMLNPLVYPPWPYLSSLWSYSQSNIEISEIILSILTFTLHLKHIPMPQSCPLRRDLHNINMPNSAVHSSHPYLSPLWSYSHLNIETSKCRKFLLYIHPPSEAHSTCPSTACRRRYIQP
jgi:hypothetical protein